MPWPQNKLEQLKITKVSLVPEGADAEAFIKIFKSKGGNTMDFEEILKSLKPEHADVIRAEITKAKQSGMDDSKAKLSQMEEDKKKMEDEITKMKGELAQAQNTATGTPEDDILKSVDPAVRAIIEKTKLQAQAAEEAIKKMNDERIEKEATSIAKSLPNLNAKEEDIVGIYKSLNGVNAETCSQVFDILKAANATLATSEAFVSKGSNSSASIDDADKAWSEIEKAADEMASKLTISKAAAVSEVMKAKPELYQAYLNAQNQ